MTCKLEILDYDSADIDEVWNWVPESAQDVFFHLEIEVGEVGKEGGNLFQMEVATLEGLKNIQLKYPEKKFASRGLIILDKYSWESLLNYLKTELRQCSRKSWQESIQCLSKKFLWEYENFKWDYEDDQ